MTVKEFLKPNRWKIVLTVILIIWFFIGFLMIGLNESSLNPILTVILLPGFILSLPIFSLFLSPSPFLFFINSLAGNFASIIDLIFLIVLVGIYSYFLSCLIFWIYDFSKKKSKIVEKKGFLERWEEKHKDLTGFISLITDFFAHGNFYMAFILFGIVLLGIFRLFLIILIVIIILIVYLILKLRSKKKNR